MIGQNYKYLSPWDPSDKKKSPPLTVVTCFLKRGNKFLALQRAREDIQHNLWGIPGGKLDQGEDPIKGLVREIREETGVNMDPMSFSLMGTACSKTPCDGTYGLYLYHATLSEDKPIHINPSEHHAFLWVAPEEFETLELLTAQREAYLSVKEQLLNTMKENMESLC